MAMLGVASCKLYFRPELNKKASSAEATEGGASRGSDEARLAEMRGGREALAEISQEAFAYMIAFFLPLRRFYTKKIIGKI
jgi:hypothetical protein